MPSTTIHDLPNELLAHTLSFLDSSPPYFEQRLREDPASIRDAAAVPDSTGSVPGNQPLKAASCVCSLWRRSVLPRLFRHVFWTFERLERPPPGVNPADQIGLLSFLRHSGLARNVESLTLLIDYPERSIGADDSQASRYGVLLNNGSDHSFAKDKTSSSDGPWENNWLWHAIFEHMDPLRITFISSPAILASLLSRNINLTSGWAFQMRYHILSLSQPSRSIPGPGALVPLPSDLPSLRPSPPEHIPCDLFTIRKWSSLLINEGSFGNIYGTYEFFQHSPPSLLPVLLAGEDPSLQPFLQGTLHSLSYIAIFPLSSHMINVFVPKFPPVSSLYFQIVPRGHAFFVDGFVRSSVDYSDLWVERNISYSHLLAAIFYGEEQGGRWDRLRVLETGDTSDQEAWQRAVQLVEQINAAHNTGWRVRGEGYFVKDSDNEET